MQKNKTLLDAELENIRREIIEANLVKSFPDVSKPSSELKHKMIAS